MQAKEEGVGYLAHPLLVCDPQKLPEPPENPGVLIDVPMPE